MSGSNHPTGAPSATRSDPPGWLRDLAATIEAAGLGGLLATLTPPPEAQPRRAAVLVLVGDGASGPDLLLLQRHDQLRSHPGQPAFPGGGVEAQDSDSVAAALREAREECGVDPAGVEVLACLPELWLPPSGNAVTPVLAWWAQPGEVRPADPVEVASVARVPLADLADPANRGRVVHPRGYVGPAFVVADMVVWGFTAGIIDRLLALSGWERPWDTDRMIELPAVTTR